MTTPAACEHPPHRVFCGTCAPTATPAELSTCATPAPGRGDWMCAHCAGVLCAGGHTHVRHPGEVCPRC